MQRAYPAAACVWRRAACVHSHFVCLFMSDMRRAAVARAHITDYCIPQAMYGNGWMVNVFIIYINLKHDEVRVYTVGPCRGSTDQTRARSSSRLPHRLYSDIHRWHRDASVP